MLKAVQKETNNKVASFNMPDGVNPRDENWECPICKSELTYVKESIDGRIEHFRHKTTPDHISPYESQEHERMKKHLYMLLRKQHKNVELEKWLPHPVKNQIADIYVETKNDPIAVEIQHSYQPKDDFAGRTMLYNMKNVAVLWIIDIESFGSGPARKQARYWLKSQYYGRFYGYDEEYQLFAVRNPFLGEQRKVSGYTVFIPDNQDGHYTIGRFYDQAWWT